MNQIEFIKHQAKNLFKDWQTQSITTGSDGSISYHYDSKFYDVESLFSYFEWDDKDRREIILARAQHLISKMLGYKQWNDLIHVPEIELELAEVLLRRFKSALDIENWKEVLNSTGIAQYGTEVVLDYAKQYFELSDRKEIVNLPVNKITLLSGKLKMKEFSNFDDEHNPEGTLRKDSTVVCSCCESMFNFNQSKVIKDNDKNRTIVVCKNFPNCKGTYLDYHVISPTVMFGKTRTDALEKGIRSFRTNFTMDTKVRCLHCGKEFLYNEATAVQFPDDDEPLVYCKNYPDCNGSLMDMLTED